MNFEILVNKDHLLDSDYIPNDLIITDQNEENFHKYKDPNLKPMIHKTVFEHFLRLQEDALKDGLNIILDNRLREINYGDLEGVPRPTLSQDVWDVFNNNPEKLNAEPIISVFNRIKSFFDELDYDKNIIIVTHGGALRTIMYYINNKDNFDKKIYDEKYRDTKINNGAFFECDLLKQSIKEITF